MYTVTNLPSVRLEKPLMSQLVIVTVGAGSKQILHNWDTVGGTTKSVIKLLFNRRVMTILCMHVLIFTGIFVMNFIFIALHNNISIMYKHLWVLELL